MRVFNLVGTMLILASCVWFLSYCGSDDDDDETPAATTALTDAQALSLITANCAKAGCHNGSQPPQITTVDEIVTNKTNSLARMRLAETASTFMPSGGWTDATQKDAFISWLDAK